MFKDTIFQYFAYTTLDKVELDKEVCGIQREEVEKCKKALLKASEKNSEYTKLIKELIDAVDKLHGSIIGKYYEEGFKAGIKFALEICGYERKDKE